MKFNHPYYRLRAEKWRALYLSGMTIGEIAQRYHYAAQYVSKEIGRLHD